MRVLVSLSLLLSPSFPSSLPLPLCQDAARKAILVMLQRQELELRSQGKYICRRR